MNRYYLGIDLGTTYCCIYYYDEKKHVAEAIKDQDSSQIASYVSYNKDDVVYGSVAQNQVMNNPENTVYDSKRMIGKKFSNPDFQIDRQNWPFNTSQADDDSIRINVSARGKKLNLRPEEVSGNILRYLKATAEKVIGECSDVVITIPASFDEIQREKTIFAAKEIAGFKNVALLDEPSAAALEYAQNLPPNSEEKVLIFDFGGGTLDISIVEISRNKCKVLKTKGNPHFGGQDIDKILVDKFKADFEKKNRVTIDPYTLQGQRALLSLKMECEQLKKNLSQKLRCEIKHPKLFNGYDLEGTLSRKQFEICIGNILTESLNMVIETIKEVNLTRDNISQIILVGGSSQIPAVADNLKNYFKISPINSIQPLEAVAKGACLQCFNIHKAHGFDPNFSETGIEEIDPNDSSATMSSDSTPPPIQRKKTFTSPVLADNPEPEAPKPKPQPQNKTKSSDSEDIEENPSTQRRTRRRNWNESSSDSGEEHPKPKPKPKPISESDSDEVEKPKPAPPSIQGHQIKLVEKVNLSFGVRIQDDKFSKIIDSGMKIPAKNSRTFTTTVDYQEYIDVAIFQGESENALENRFIGMITINDIPKRKKGEVDAILELSIDRSGILTLNASIDNKKVQYVFNKELGANEQEMSEIRSNLEVIRDPMEEFNRLSSRITGLNEKLRAKYRKERNNPQCIKLRKRVEELLDNIQFDEAPSQDEIKQLVQQMQEAIRDIYTAFPNIDE
ncbi:dnaK protein [Trichomonas vaginalis G3]|uniref:DnaK protein n=1 Tax=Trichomonas vaginalis (strain ATCC PRA-98 / G3) TaxID=412133 RepID=A2ECF5_TRIV3|nr:unfolded protein binding [Trichomonas vaginalis G3]EAY09650.1 dnaK protein [Trichomonas vaginalis G3]KAI5528652.1 unfolded protein binding [Trichomonas vaginalis G3]|eukprot:XP_001321873.1 dnaK protein [Trichomonas vaginalis G3]